MLDAVAAAFGVPAETVRRAFMLSGGLPATSVATMVGGSAALDAFRLELGRPVRPMLASAADSLDAALAELGEVSVEYKLDGARIQVHRDGAEVRVWTRTLREITADVPELVELVRGLPCSSVVLDGETLALTDDGRPRSFQETMSRFGADSPQELLLRPFFFDCLHRDGADLLDTPLAHRLAALDAVAGPYRIPSVQDAAAAPGLLDASLAAGHEGVLVKSLSAPYAAGRRGRVWQKVKPVRTLDLVVLAAEWGPGRRRGWLSNLHLGARDPGGGPPVMVGKTFKGLTDQLLAWQTCALQEIARQEITQRTEEYVVHVRPKLVVEIELDGVQVSPRYPGGVALRFARVLRYRPDKDARDADTIDAVRALLPTPSRRDGREAFRRSAAGDSCAANTPPSCASALSGPLDKVAQGACSMSAGTVIQRTNGVGPMSPVPGAVATGVDAEAIVAAGYADMLGRLQARSVVDDGWSALVDDAVALRRAARTPGVPTDPAVATPGPDVHPGGLSQLRDAGGPGSRQGPARLPTLPPPLRHPGNRDQLTLKGLPTVARCQMPLGPRAPLARTYFSSTSIVNWSTLSVHSSTLRGSSFTTFRTIGVKPLSAWLTATWRTSPVSSQYRISFLCLSIISNTGASLVGVPRKDFPDLKALEISSAQSVRSHTVPIMVTVAAGPLRSTFTENRLKAVSAPLPK